MRRICLAVTSICDQKCPYCLINLGNERLNLNKIKKINFSNINYINITGGEPGTLNLNEVTQLFEELKSIGQEKIRIFTNGLFIEKYYDLFPKLIYTHHVISSERKLYEKENIKKVLVIDQSNIDDLKTVIEKNINSLFFVIIAWNKEAQYDTTFFEKLYSIIEKENVQLDFMDKSIFLNRKENIILMPKLQKILHKNRLEVYNLFGD